MVIDGPVPWGSVAHFVDCFLLRFLLRSPWHVARFSGLLSRLVCCCQPTRSHEEPRGATAAAGFLCARPCTSHLSRAHISFTRSKCCGSYL